MIGICFGSLFQVFGLLGIVLAAMQAHGEGAWIPQDGAFLGFSAVGVWIGTVMVAFGIVDEIKKP